MHLPFHLAILPQEVDMPPTIQEYIYTRLFSTVFFAEYWKLPKCPSIGEWLNQLWFIDTIDYFSAVETGKILRSLLLYMK